MCDCHSKCIWFKKKLVSSSSLEEHLMFLSQKVSLNTQSLSCFGSNHMCHSSSIFHHSSSSGHFAFFPRSALHKCQRFLHRLTDHSFEFAACQFFRNSVSGAQLPRFQSQDNACISSWSTQCLCTSFSSLRKDSTAIVGGFVITTIPTTS